MLKRHLRVFVYRNLNNDCFSVREVATGKVVAHTHGVWVEDAVFRVGEKGRQRVLREGRKNVHAGVLGTLVLDPVAAQDHMREVFYDPFRGPDFVDGKGDPVHEARLVHLCDGKVFVTC